MRPPRRDDRSCDIAIVGAGAAGLAAAIFAGETAAGLGTCLRIVALDGAARLGRKILVSGGGRCNVAHAVVRPEDFNGSRPVIRNVLAAFDAEATVRWFRGLGVTLVREDSGKLFPATERARTVLDALLRRCGALGVDLQPGCRVTAVDHSGSLVVTHEHGALTARRVIMATGGRSLPRTGSDGTGWEILRRLGHTVTPTFPALVPLLLLPGMFHAQLAGVSHVVELSVIVEGRVADRRTGSLLWTHFGVSGPVVLDASRHWIRARREELQVELRCNFLPGRAPAAVEQWLQAGTGSRPRLSLRRRLGTELPDRVATLLLRQVGIDPATPLGQLSRRQRQDLVPVLAAFPLPVREPRGWDHAEVTAGGVPLNEIDYRTMASRRIAGLHLVGELLDCDGRIGGFNFQWAWATGFLAGRAAARALCEA